MGPEIRHFSDVEVARVTLLLDEAITLRRRGCVASLTAYNGAVPSLQIKPMRIELAVSTALAHIYGSALSDECFVRVVEFVAARGAVKMVQSALWGQELDDARLATLLLDHALH